MKVLCVFGKYQYGDPARGVGTEYEAFVPTLRRMGHDVNHFESWDRSLYRDFCELNNALLRKVEDVRPDVLLSVQRDYEIWLETLESIREHSNTATISWTTDDSWKYEQVSRFIGKSYHAMTTTYEDVIPRYHRDGIRNVLLTQWAAADHMLREPLSASECRYPVSFVGAAHGNRAARIAQLQALGIEVHCFGQGWPNGPVSAESVAQIVRDSVISLNFSNSNGRNQIKARTFEVPGYGGFLLTETAPGLERAFEFGSEIATFASFDELVQRIRYYLDHPEARDRIARAGHARTHNQHTYSLRVKEVLDFALSSRDCGRINHGSLAAINWSQALLAHDLTPGLRVLRAVLKLLGVTIWGKRRGPRAARRLLFELSWRLAGRKTFTASGWPGRLFPEQ